MVPVAGYKHSLMPLIPAVIKGTPLEALHNKMLENDVQLAQFESAVKYGGIQNNGSYTNLYNKDGGSGLTGEFKFS
jgi:hypothetical protein